jgi:hypothetical protein
MPSNSLPRVLGRVRVGALASVVLLTACQATAATPVGSTDHSTAATASASSTPTASASAAPPGPLVALMNPVDQVHYTISLVGVDGRVVAQATAAYGDQKPVPFPGSAAGGSPSGMANPVVRPIASYQLLPDAGACCDAFLPSISVSDTRVYFPDGPASIRYLGRNGSTGLATTLPAAGAKARTIFSVSPDDQRIAIGVFDWSSQPMISTVSVRDLRGGESVEVERSFPLYGWPVGWHAGNLVLARIPAFGGAPNPNAATAYNLVNPTTRENLGYLGGMTCPVVGPLSRAGTACVAARCHCIMAVDWSGMQTPTYTYADPSELNWAALSPDGHAMIFSEIYGPKTGVGIWRDGAAALMANYSGTRSQWLDDSHTIVDCASGEAGGECFGIQDLSGQSTVEVRLPGSIVGVVPGGL